MKAVLQWVLKTMMKDQTGIVQTMPKKDIVDFNVAMTAERLMRNGVDPNSLKNANQVENALNQIEKRPAVQEKIKSTKSAKVFDLEGKEIDPKKGIMGGKQIPDDDLPPPGSRGGSDDIAAPVQSTEETIKNMIEAENKKNIAKMKNRKIVKDAVDNVSPGFVKGDRKYNAQLVAEDLAEKKFGKDFYDLDQKQQMDLYGEALDGLSVDLDKFAQGGRAGFFMGSKYPRGLGLLRELLNFFGKKSDVVRNPSDTLKVVNPKAFNKMLEDAKGKMIPKEGIMATDKIKDYQTAMASDRIEMVKDMIERGKRMKGADDKILAYKNQIRNNFMEDLNMSEKEAEQAADRMATLAMDMTKMEKTPEITEEGILQLENVLKNMETGGKKKRDLNADGGRIGFKDGMDRRTFMKIMGGLATLPFVGKFVKPAMPLIKKGAELTAPALDKIIETVMSAGKLVSQSGRRLKELTTKKKLKDIEVEEDMMDGPSYTIKTKDKTIYYKPGKQDEMGIEDDIIEVIEDTVTKKAGGGVARMLGE